MLMNPLSGQTFHRLDSKEYYVEVQSSVRNYSQAVEECARINAALAIVNSQAIQDFLVNNTGNLTGKFANILNIKFNRPVGVVVKSLLLGREIMDSIPGPVKYNTLLLTMALHRCNLSSERGCYPVVMSRRWIPPLVAASYSNIFVSILCR